MALTACRECSQQVSSEAATCPHCGVRSPAHVPATPVASTPIARPQTPAGPAPKQKPKWGRILILVGVVGTIIGLVIQHAGTSNLDSAQLEQTLEAHYSGIISVQVTASCPRQIPMKKGAIIDCTLTREDTGKMTDVRVTQDDSNGHYSYQAADPVGFSQP